MYTHVLADIHRFGLIIILDAFITSTTIQHKNSHTLCAYRQTFWLEFNSVLVLEILYGHTYKHKRDNVPLCLSTHKMRFSSAKQKKRTKLSQTN